MRHYETTFILRPGLGEAGFTEIIDRTTGIVADFGGATVALERIGLRKLAYTIKKEAQGYYVYLNFAAPGEAVAELERIFRIDDRVLRYLTVKLADSIDEAGMEAERERLERVRAARAARDAAEAEEEARNRGRRREAPAREESADGADADEAEDNDEADASEDADGAEEDKE